MTYSFGPNNPNFGSVLFKGNYIPLLKFLLKGMLIFYSKKSLIHNQQLSTLLYNAKEILNCLPFALKSIYLKLK